MEAAAVAGVPCFVEAVIGARPNGSWWGHPEGKRIYRLAEALLDSGEVVSLKLVDGKATWVHRSLWPQVLAVVTDASWRAASLGALPASARRLVKRVEAHGEAQPARATEADDVKRVEAACLVRVTSAHTDRGRHEKRLESWAAWSKRERVRPAKVREALAVLSSSLHGRTTVLSPSFVGSPS